MQNIFSLPTINYKAKFGLRKKQLCLDVYAERKLPLASKCKELHNM